MRGSAERPLLVFYTTRNRRQSQTEHAPSCSRIERCTLRTFKAQILPREIASTAFQRERVRRFQVAPCRATAWFSRQTTRWSAPARSHAGGEWLAVRESQCCRALSELDYL